MRKAVLWIVAMSTFVLAMPLWSAPVSADTVTITLYGDAGSGWGYSSTNLTNPGPMIVVYQGDVVKLTLIGTDPVDHNWFIDYNNDTLDNDGGPSSPVFRGATPILYQFIADRAGNDTYLCRFHTITMTGKIVVRPPRAVGYELFGNAGVGWGFNSTNLARPGPTLVVYQGGAVTLNLSGTDPVDHNWFIDYNNNSLVDGGEPLSTTFRGATVITWSFVPDRVGNFTYRCGFHPATMYGVIEVRYTGVGEARTGGPVIELVPAIMAGTLVFVFLFAAGYHLHAVRAQRRAK